MDQNSFLFQAMIYLVAAVVSVPIAKKLGLGSVLGYLVAGIIIGPFALGFVGHEGENVMHFAEFGVVMMLFIIGLELEPALLLRMRRAILGLGGLQVILTTIVIASIAYAFALPFIQALALGMILSLSSTAIVLQTLNEKSLMRTAAGQSSFSVLLFQDIAVIPMLAIFPLLAVAPPIDIARDDKTFVADLPGWIQTIVVLGSVIIIVLLGKYFLRSVLRIVASTRLRELFTATALLLIISIAVLMTEVGLSPALGTFLAGVVLANSEYKHELESDIEPFKGLLLGLFFIAVGASIDFALVKQNPLTIIGLVVLLMFVKFIVLFTLGKIFRLRLDQNMFFAFALSQVGEFAFVLFSFSRQHNILNEELTNMMIAVVAISMAVTPLILLMNEKLIMPLTAKKEQQSDSEPDQINEFNPVIIAGFGHFGNTIGRFLRAHSIPMTILDNDSERVELLRKMGFKVYYGDASRYDLLQSAGASKAKLIIIAIDNTEKRLELIQTIKKHFPNLRMLVRAKDRFDAYDQMNAGMLHVYRETIDTALRVGVDVMSLLGHRKYSSQRAARTFLKIDEQNLKKLASIQDKEEYILSAKADIEELEKMIQADRNQLIYAEDKGWDEEGLIAAAGKTA